MSVREFGKGSSSSYRQRQSNVSFGNSSMSFRKIGSGADQAVSKKISRYPCSAVPASISTWQAFHLVPQFSQDQSYQLKKPIFSSSLCSSVVKTRGTALPSALTVT